MPDPSQLNSDTHSTERTHDTSVVTRLGDHLDYTQLQHTRETLDGCVDIENDPSVILSALESIDYELVAATATALDESLDYVHDPVVRSKSKFVDDIEVASQNLSLIADPMLERRTPEDTLSIDQATRFALQSYTANELIRQRAAINAAHQSLTRIMHSLNSTTPLEPPENTSTTLHEYLDSVLDLFGIGTFSSRSSSGRSNNSSHQRREDTTVDNSPEPLDVDEADLVWGTSSGDQKHETVFIDDRD